MQKENKTHWSRLVPVNGLMMHINGCCPHLSSKCLTLTHTHQCFPKTTPNCGIQKHNLTLCSVVRWNLTYHKHIFIIHVQLLVNCWCVSVCLCVFVLSSHPGGFCGSCPVRRGGASSQTWCPPAAARASSWAVGGGASASGPPPAMTTVFKKWLGKATVVRFTSGFSPKKVVYLSITYKSRNYSTSQVHHSVPAISSIVLIDMHLLLS